MTEKFRYRIINLESGKVEGVYTRAYHDVYDFHSPEDARNSNCHGTYLNEEKYRIAKFRITEEEIE